MFTKMASSERKYLLDFQTNLREIIRQPLPHPDAPKSSEQVMVERLLPAVIRLSNQGQSQASYYVYQYLQWQQSSAASNWLQKAAEQGYATACFKAGQAAIEQSAYRQASQYFMALLKSGDTFLIDELKALMDSSPSLQANLPMVARKISVDTNIEHGVGAFVNSLKQPQGRSQTLFAATSEQSYVPTGTEHQNSIVCPG
jgi:hypothetical protein